MDKHNTVKQYHRKLWTTEELRFVEQRYGTLLVTEIAQRLQRTPGSVKSMARRLGCGGKQLHWTDANIAVLTTHYAAGADKATIMAMLPERTWTGILSKVFALGIIRRKWQPEEYRILEKYYASEGIRVADRLPERTVSAVANQAHALKIRHPRGLRWDENELKLLAQNQHLPVTELAKLFPRRSRIAVYHHWAKLRKQQSSVK